MDELEFLRGLEGEEQQGTDLVRGSEQLVRLKQQTGYQQRRDEDLELSKEAGPVSNAAGLGAVLGGIGGAVPKPNKKDSRIGNAARGAAFGGAALGGAELANELIDQRGSVKAALKNALSSAKTGLKLQGFGMKAGINQLKTKGQRARGAGALLGIAAPALAAGGLGYAAGKHKEKKAEDANRLIAALKTIDPSLLASIGIGAGTAGVGTYLASRPQENGKGRAEEQLEETVKNHEEKPADSLRGKMHQATTKMMHGYSKAFREHPVKASLMSTVTGGMAGYGLGRMMGSNKPSIEAIKAALRGGK